MKLTINPYALKQLERCEYADVLTVKDAQTILGIGRISVYHLIESQQVQAFQIGKTYKIPKKEVEKFLKSQKRGETK